MVGTVGLDLRPLPCEEKNLFAYPACRAEYVVLMKILCALVGHLLPQATLTAWNFLSLTSVSNSRIAVSADINPAAPEHLTRRAENNG